MPNLYVFDIDKTLKPYIGSISNSTVKAITHLKEQHYVCLATGRCYSEAKDVAKKLGVDYLVTSGGFEAYEKGVCFYSYPQDFSIELESLKRKKPYHLIVTHEGIFSYYLPFQMKILTPFRFLFSKLSSPHHFLSFLKEVNIVDELPQNVHIQKIIVFSKYSSKLPYQKAFGPVYSYEHIDKTLGLKQLMENLKNVEEVISFGDSFNDLTVAKMANRSYARDKGDVSLINLADDVFDLKDGIYRIIKNELEKES